MKTAGTIILALGLIIGALIAMVPTSVTIFGEEGTCGSPLLRVISQQESSDPNEQRLIDLCEDQSSDRLIPAGLVALAGVVIGGGLILAGSRTRTGPSAASASAASPSGPTAPPPGAPPAPGGPSAL